MASLGPITEPEIDVEGDPEPDLSSPAAEQHSEPEESLEPMALSEAPAPPTADVPVDAEVQLGLSPARAPGFWGDIQL
jgi:hypothetical protein